MAALTPAAQLLCHFSWLSFLDRYGNKHHQCTAGYFDQLHHPLVTGQVCHSATVDGFDNKNHCCINCCFIQLCNPCITWQDCNPANCGYMYVAMKIICILLANLVNCTSPWVYYGRWPLCWLWQDKSDLYTWLFWSTILSFIIPFTLDCFWKPYVYEQSCIFVTLDYF